MAEVDITLKQIGFRDGDRGEVHDTYELNVYDETVLVLRHYVEYTLEEVPLTVTVSKQADVNIV